MPQWVTRIKNDLLMKQFIPLKILHFFMIGGMTTLFPFLTIQARSLGITGEELGIIYSLLPVVGIFGPSLAGLIADKIGNFKLFLSLSVGFSGLAALLFIAIPPGRIQHVLPEHMPLSVQCSLGLSKVDVDPPITCDIKNDVRNSMINISTCFYECSEPTVENLHSVDEFLHSWCINSGNCQLFEEIELSDKFDNHYEVEGRRLEPGQESQIQRNLYLFSNSSLEMAINLNDSESLMKIHEPFCPDFKQFLESSDELFPSRKENTTNEKKCWLKCNAFGNSAEICSNKKYTETLNPVLTIITYILVRLINSLTLASSFTLFEGAVVAILKEHNGDIGLQRVYGNLGQIVMTPISGKLIDYFSHLNEKEDYNPAFFLYCALKFLCAFIFLFINLEFKQPSKRVMKDFKELIIQPRVSTFIFFTMVIGTSYGFVETFLFWLLEDLGADKSLMGITVTVGAAFGIPLLMMSAFFIQKLGHVNTLTLCAFIYVIRFVGYSLINNPWLAMPFEALESFTNSLMTVTSISYAGSLSQPSTVASMQGLYAGTYHGFGRGVGSLAGGIMIKRLGNRATFQVLGASCGIIGLIYFIVNKIFFTKKMDETVDDSVVKGQDGEAIGNKSLEMDNKSLEMDSRKTITTNAATDYGTNSTDNGEAGRENLAFEDKP